MQTPAMCTVCLVPNVVLNMGEYKWYLHREDQNKNRPSLTSWQATMNWSFLVMQIVHLFIFIMLKSRKITIHTILTRFLLIAFLAFGRFIPMTTIPETQCYIMLVNNDTKVLHTFQKMRSQLESTKYKDYIMKPDMLYYLQQTTV